MPIYAYRCEACGFAKDVLQKMSDPQLTVCLSCGATSFRKQVTAAGFQLKGTGWYATDFRGGAKPGAAAAGADSSAEGAPTAKTGNEDKAAGSTHAGSDAGNGAAKSDAAVSQPVSTPSAGSSADGKSSSGGSTKSPG
jgi:putative FmdB family regulatory protein